MREFFEGGFIVKETNKLVVRFRIENLTFILKVIIALFNSNPLQSKKVMNYISFSKACLLIKNKAHFTKEGLKIIKDLKSNMNRGIKNYILKEFIAYSSQLEISKGFQRN